MVKKEWDIRTKIIKLLCENELSDQDKVAIINGVLITVTESLEKGSDAADQLAQIVLVCAQLEGAKDHGPRH